jgi:proteasome lid subunit RPN8/RPN11
MAKLILRNAAFMNLVASCIETYKFESFGILLGSRRKSVYTARYAVTYTSAERDYEYVRIDDKRKERINHSLKYITAQRVIGDFHSHPDYPDILSRTDRKDLLRNKRDALSVLVIIKKKTKKVLWAHNEDLSVSGTLGNYHIKIRAYQSWKPEEQIHRIRVRLPFLKSLNKKLRKA